MSESSLTAAFNDLTGELGDWLGYGRGEANGENEWDDYQSRAITQHTKGGMRRFYYSGYDWTFLRPIRTLTITSGAQTIPLPDDYGGLDGKITVSQDGGSGFWPIDIVSDVRRHYAATPDTSGRPLMASLDPLKPTTGQRGQRWQLMVFPEADDTYTLQLPMYVNPDYLTGNHPYAYGGPQHSQTLLAACKASAEVDRDGKQNGPQMMEFMRLLEVSKQLDQRNRPQFLGYNGDRSDRRRGFNWHNMGGLEQPLPVTVNGVDPTI